jgi:hypothetical protein
MLVSDHQLDLLHLLRSYGPIKWFTKRKRIQHDMVMTMDAIRHLNWMAETLTKENELLKKKLEDHSIVTQLAVTLETVDSLDSELLELKNSIRELAIKCGFKIEGGDDV